MPQRWFVLAAKARKERAQKQKYACSSAGRALEQAYGRFGTGNEKEKEEAIWGRASPEG